LTSPAIAPLRPERPAPATLLLRRIWALALRHIYLHMGSWPRLVEMMYWPLVNMAMWGFASLYLTRKLGHIEAVGSALVAGVVLTEIFLRPSITALMLFLEEVWSRNLGHLFASPIRMQEYTAGILGIAVLRTSIALIPVFLLTKYMFGFSLFSLGWPLAAFVASLR
jgi:ABC-2 type transport system permease protein